jgi:hypothetical protein
MVTMLLVACLIGVSLYLAKRLADANTTNAALRSQVASLKRQLQSGRS